MLRLGSVQHLNRCNLPTRFRSRTYKHDSGLCVSSFAMRGRHHHTPGLSLAPATSASSHPSECIPVTLSSSMIEVVVFITCSSTTVQPDDTLQSLLAPYIGYVQLYDESAKKQFQSISFVSPSSVSSEDWTYRLFAKTVMYWHCLSGAVNYLATIPAPKPNN